MITGSANLRSYWKIMAGLSSIIQFFWILSLYMFIIFWVLRYYQSSACISVLSNKDVIKQTNKQHNKDHIPI